MSRVMSRVVLVAAFVCSAAVAAFAQQTTTSSETKNFEVLAVNGNELVVKLPEGTREMTVPDDFRFTVNGQPLSVHQLKQGMKGTASITTRTTTTPVTVTEVKNGTVVNATAGSIIVRSPSGEVRQFTQRDVDKRGVMLMLDGKPAQVSDLHAGDKLSATIITSGPPHVMTQREVQATLAAAPAASAATAPAATPAPAQAPRQVAAATPAPAPAPAAPRARSLPKTASSWPALGFASVLSLALGLALTVRRRLVG